MRCVCEVRNNDNGINSYDENAYPKASLIMFKRVKQTKRFLVSSIKTLTHETTGLIVFRWLTTIHEMRNTKEE